MRWDFLAYEVMTIGHGISFWCWWCWAYIDGRLSMSALDWAIYVLSGKLNDFKSQIKNDSRGVANEGKGGTEYNGPRAIGGT